MDITSLALPGLVALGVVNVLTFWKPDLDSKIKFAASFVVALAVLFIPADLGMVWADKIKEALTISLAASGVYKLSQKIGGDSDAKT